MERREAHADPPQQQQADARASVSAARRRSCQAAAAAPSPVAAAAAAHPCFCVQALCHCCTPLPLHAGAVPPHRAAWKPLLTPAILLFCVCACRQGLPLAARPAPYPGRVHAGGSGGRCAPSVRRGRLLDFKYEVSPFKYEVSPWWLLSRRRRLPAHMGSFRSLKQALPHRLHGSPC